jgi:phasin family protein
MTDRIFDPNTWFDAYREAYASVYKAQQEAFKAVERFARVQYAVAGDYLESGLAQARAAFGAKTPVELLSKQAEFGGQLGEKLRARAEEFTSLASETQGTFAKVLTEFTTKAAASTRKAA